MPTVMEVRALTIATENAWTELTEDGRSGTATKMVPAGASRISQLMLLWVPGATAGVANVAFRLEGQGISIPGATLEFCGGSSAPGGTNTMNTVIRPVVIETDIPVNVGSEVRVLASVNGADVGSSEVACTIVYT